MSNDVTENPANRSPVQETPPEKTEAGGQELGGPKGLEPTRYGDWERKGKCVDF